MPKTASSQNFPFLRSRAINGATYAPHAAMNPRRVLRIAVRHGHGCPVIRDDLISGNTSPRRGSATDQRKCKVENQRWNNKKQPSRSQPSITRRRDRALEVPLKSSSPFPFCKCWQDSNDRDYQNHCEDQVKKKSEKSSDDSPQRLAYTRWRGKHQQQGALQ